VRIGSNSMTGDGNIGEVEACTVCEKGRLTWARPFWQVGGGLCIGGHLSEKKNQGAGNTNHLQQTH